MYSTVQLVPVQQNNERIKALISMHPDHPKKKKNPSSTIILVTSVLASWGGGVGKTTIFQTHSTLSCMCKELEGDKTKTQKTKQQQQQQQQQQQRTTSKGHGTYTYEIEKCLTLVTTKRNSHPRGSKDVTSTYAYSAFSFGVYPLHHPRPKAAPRKLTRACMASRH
jgi:hypothetical protein